MFKWNFLFFNLCPLILVLSPAVLTHCWGTKKGENKGGMWTKPFLSAVMLSLSTGLIELKTGKYQMFMIECILFPVQWHLFHQNYLTHVCESPLRSPLVIASGDYKFMLLRTLFHCFYNTCEILCKFPSVCIPQLSKTYVGLFLW